MFKTGYDSAHEVITIKTYPLDRMLNIAANENWEEVRVIRSVLGSHLLVIT